MFPPAGSSPRLAGTDEVREAIRKGQICADVVQQPGRIGEFTVGARRDHLALLRQPQMKPRSFRSLARIAEREVAGAISA